MCECDSRGGRGGGAMHESQRAQPSRRGGFGGSKSGVAFGAIAGADSTAVSVRRNRETSTVSTTVLRSTQASAMRMAGDDDMKSTQRSDLAKVSQTILQS